MTLNEHRSVVFLSIFKPNTFLERACFKLKENVLVMEMKQETTKWQGFKVGQCIDLAATFREHNVNVGERWTSVIPSLNVWYSKVKYPSWWDASNNVLSWKSDQILRRLVIFFRNNSSFACKLYRRRIDGQNTGLEGVAGHLFRLLQIRGGLWCNCCSHMAIQEQSWRPRRKPGVSRAQPVSLSFADWLCHKNLTTPL